MATLKAKRVHEALQKARNVGRVEEPIDIGGCSLVLQNLSPEDYNLIVQETQDFDGAEYLHAYQIAHVSRSVVEIEGIDLRDVQFIEDEVPAGTYVISTAVATEAKAKKAVEALTELGLSPTLEPPDPEGELKTVKLEKSEWIRQRVNSWGREAVLVAYRKFAELVVKAETKAKENVTFQVADESVEEKFRRLLSDAKALEADLPDDMIKKILDDVGYVPLATQEENERVAENARIFAEEQAARMAKARVEADAVEASKVESKPTSAPDSAPLPRLRQPAPEIQPDPEVGQLAAKAEERMRSRQPLNQGGYTAPVPVTAPQVRTAAAVPSQIREAAVNMATVNSERASEIAALEAQMDPGLHSEVQQLQVQQTAPRELNRQPQIDGAGVKQILNRPPAVGLNPKYRPLPK